MRYASLGAGKRFRPFLVVESAALFGVPRQHALMAGAALECVHCYSLVHDDLPAMDNDDLRRGQPTVHKAFDDATAILAGDGLLTFAFDILARPETHPNPAVRVELVLALARASGLGGMAGGQMLDLAAEGRFADGRRAAAAGARGRDLAGDEDRGAAQIRLPRRRHPRPGDGRAARRARALWRRGRCRRSRSPTIFSTSRATLRLVGKQTGKDAVAGKATMVGILGTRRRQSAAAQAGRRRGESAGAVRRCRGGPDRGRKIRRRPPRLSRAMSKAFRFHRHGGPDVLRFEDVVVAEPGRGEVRMRNTAVAVNFRDVLVRSGVHAVKSFPSGIGLESAGVIEAIGPDVTGFSVGDRVAYAAGPDGSYAE